MQIIRAEVVNGFVNMRYIDLLYYYYMREDIVIVDYLNKDNQMYLAPFDYNYYMIKDPIINNELASLHIPFIKNGNYLEDIDHVFLKFFHHSWYNKLKPFLTSPIFKDILVQIKKKRDVTKVYPSQNLMFSEFLVPIYTTKALWLGELPYLKSDFANGRAFATWSAITPKSLQILNKGINSDLNVNYYLKNDLSFLTGKGIMLLNYCLASDKDKTLLHSFVPFLKEVIKVFNEKEKFSVITFGDNAKSLLPLFNNSFLKLETELPVEGWNTNNVFKIFNQNDSI